MKIVSLTIHRPTNPISGLILVVIAAAVMTLSSYLLFAKSSAYDTVRQLHNAILNEPVDLGEGVDTTSPVKAADVDNFGKSVEERVQSFDDDGDFGIGTISQQVLGF